MSFSSPYEEAIVGRGVYRLLHEHLLSTDPETSDPRDLAGPLAHYGLDRAACLAYANHYGECVGESYRLVSDVLTLAREGRRPRGLSFEGLV
jgi:hypothetical protein